MFFFWCYPTRLQACPFVSALITNRVSSPVPIGQSCSVSCPPKHLDRFVHVNRTIVAGSCSFWLTYPHFIYFCRTQCSSPYTDLVFNSSFSTFHGLCFVFTLIALHNSTLYKLRVWNFSCQFSFFAFFHAFPNIVLMFCYLVFTTIQASRREIDSTNCIFKIKFLFSFEFTHFR